jgi:hypothetical protein
VDWLRRLLAALLGVRVSSSVDDDQSDRRVMVASNEGLEGHPTPMNVSGSPDDRDEASSAAESDAADDGGSDGGDDGGGDD